MQKFRTRLLVTFVIIVVMVGGLFSRLVYLQFIWAKDHAEEAKHYHQRILDLPAERGQILDSEGDSLAISTREYRIFAFPSAIEDIKESVEQLATVLPIDKNETIRKLTDPENADIQVLIARLKSKQELDLVVALVQNLELKGYSWDYINKRFYPYSTLSSHSIGLTNLDGKGYLGLEQYYNEELSGSSGKVIYIADANGKPLPFGQTFREDPVDGKDIKVTTNSTIQYFAEKAIKEAVIATESKSASIIVSEIDTNSILAMATYPTFDLNQPFNYGDDMDEATWNAMSEREQTDYYFLKRWNNRVVSDIYEPGSTMKTLISAIAIEEGLITPESTFYCGGHRQVADQDLKCFVYPSSHGYQTVTEAFYNSCNITYMQISEKIGRERLYQYFQKLHMFEPTGIDLPNEGNPFYVPKEEVGEVELATLGYGHAININMLHMVSAISAVVNGGIYHKPHICSQIGDQVVPIGPGERVFSEETSLAVRGMMEAMVKHSGSIIDMDGVRIGGKSGTTVKIVDGEYDNDVVISSFIAFAPMEDPKYCVYVLIDEPKIADYGLRVAAPVVKRIFEDMFRYYSVFDAAENRNEVIVPQLVGLSVEDAGYVAADYGLTLATNPIKVDDKAKVVLNQYPEAGSKVPQGFVVIVNVESPKEGNSRE